MNNSLTDALVEEILNIRDSGVVNMLDVYGVQREAYKREFLELVSFIEEHRDIYSRFILSGERA